MFLLLIYAIKINITHIAIVSDYLKSEQCNTQHTFHCICKQRRQKNEKKNIQINFVDIRKIHGMHSSECDNQISSKNTFEKHTSMRTRHEIPPLPH